MDRYTWPGVMALFLLFVLLAAKFDLLQKNWFTFSACISITALTCFMLQKEIKYALPEEPITKQIWNTKGDLNLKRTVWLTDSEDKRLGLIKGLIYYNKGQYLGALFTDKSTLGDNRCAMNVFNIDHIISFKVLDDSLKKRYDITETVFKSDSLLIYKHITPIIESKKKVRHWKCD